MLSSWWWQMNHLPFRFYYYLSSKAVEEQKSKSRWLATANLYFSLRLYVRGFRAGAPVCSSGTKGWRGQLLPETRPCSEQRGRKARGGVSQCNKLTLLARGILPTPWLTAGECKPQGKPDSEWGMLVPRRGAASHRALCGSRHPFIGDQANGGGQ